MTMSRSVTRFGPFSSPSACARKCSVPRKNFSRFSRPEIPSCLILDVRLPGITGLEFQGQLSNLGSQIPIIFITAHGDIPMTARAMKAGAVEFLTKPFQKDELLQSIHQAIERDRARREEDAQFSGLRSRFETLTSREKEVMNLVVSGMLNSKWPGSWALVKSRSRYTAPV